MNPRNSNKYDVFLSFKGEDTRDNFTSHLYSALSQRSIQTFIDDQLIRGDEISQSLLDTIEASSISIIVFSEGYASSRWCLDELLKILDCKHNYGQIVIPVFYRVDPSHVRKQTGSFGGLFLKLGERFPEVMQRWRNALTEAANLSGFNSHVIRPESKLIDEIANEVLKRLDDAFQSDNKDLVGVERPIKEIELLLGTESRDVYKLGIWGIGGIGKTTIAGAVFSKISRHFEGSYFAHNVREAEENGGLAHLRQQLLSTLLSDGNVKNFPNIGLNFQSKRLAHKKVLIVFDDVSHPRQIEFLIGCLDRFALGSRILITTRDKQVLTNCGADKIYQMKELAYADALKLFSQYAFGGGHPVASYTELTHKAIKYVQGLPLALKVLGCFLSGRSKEEWESAVMKLEIVPHMEIQEVLKISYDGLDDFQKNIFLDIACFFVGEHRDKVLSFLDASGLFPQIGLSVLIDRSLITISKYNIIRMHDLLRDMGREIVRKESIDHPEERSRLWDHKDIYEVLTKNMGTRSIKGISLDMCKVHGEIQLHPCTFTKMPKLRLLKFYGKNKCRVSGFQGPRSTEMRYFEWHEYPVKTLNIHAENLVSLILPRSQVEQLWDDVQNLVNLKEIDFRDSLQLTKLPDLSQAKNLERLIARSCSSLRETHPSVQYLNKLKILDLDYCKSLKRLPTSIHSKSLQVLGLRGCSNLKNFPEISSCNIKELVLEETGIEELPSYIDCLSELCHLYIQKCSRLKYIASTIFKLKSLERTEISDCSKLKRFPEIPCCNIDRSAGIGQLSSSILELKNCSRLESFPSSLCMFKSLTSLKIIDCPNLKRLPDELGNLQRVKVLTVQGTAIREVPESLDRLSSLAELYLNGNNLERIPECLGQLSSLAELCLNDNNLKSIPENLGQLSSLRRLILNKNNLKRVPESIKHLSKLEKLDISYCESLRTLTKLPCKLREIQAHHCSSLEAFSSGSSSISFRSSVDLRNCFKLDPNELCEIVQDSLQKDHSRWRKKMQSYNDKWISGRIRILYSGNEIPKCVIHRRMYIPGNEIPMCFMFQSMGSSVALETPPADFFNNKILIGFAFCAVVAFEKYHDSDQYYTYLECAWKVKSKDGYGDVAWDVGTINYVKSDHMLLGYYLFDTMNLDYLGKYSEVNEASFHIQSSNRSGRRLDCGEVKKCGIRLLYTEDSTESTEEEEEPHPKRLKHSSTPSQLVFFG